MGETIAISWPAAPLSEAGWRTRLEDLATKAESLVGRPCSLQQTAELALELVGLLWPALGEASTVAATCRASLVMGAPGCIVSSSPGDQWAAIHSQLDEIWHQAQTNPAAAVVQLPPPMLSEVRPDVAPRKTRAPMRAKPADLEPAAVDVDVDELPAAWLDSTEPEHPPVEAPKPPAPDLEPPATWLSGIEVAELFEVSLSTVASWRRSGRMGARGETWTRKGRLAYFDPAVIEKLEAGILPAGFDQLVAEVQAP